MCTKEEQKHRNSLLLLYNLKDFLLKRYEDPILCDKIISLLGFPTAMHIQNYVERLNKFLLSDNHAKIKLAFDLYDTNNDGKICLVDLFRDLKNLS